MSALIRAIQALIMPLLRSIMSYKRLAPKMHPMPLAAPKQRLLPAIELIKKWEGLRLEAYQDIVGVWTVGYGLTGPSIKKGTKITKDEAEAKLNHIVIGLASKIAGLVPKPLTQGQMCALVSFCYNLGIGAFQKSTMLRLINEGRHKEAAEEFDKWVFAGGKRVKGLVSRRQAEKQLFTT